MDHSRLIYDLYCQLRIYTQQLQSVIVTIEYESNITERDLPIIFFMLFYEIYIVL